MVATSFGVTDSNGSVPTLAYFKASMGGAGQVGGMILGNFYLQQTAATGNLTVGTDYQAFNVLAEADANDNGNSGAYSGDMYGGAMGVTLTSGATFWNGARPLEIGISVQTGASVHYVDGLNIVLRPNNAVAGDRQNSGFSVGAGSGATATMTVAYGIGAWDGFNPLAASASIMTFIQHAGSSSGPTITNGIDLANFTFTGNAFDSPGFAIDGNGNGIFSSTTAPTMSAGHVVIGGTFGSLPTLGTNGEGYMGALNGAGIVLSGRGSVDDVELLDHAGAVACHIPAGTTGMTCASATITGAFTNSGIASSAQADVVCTTSAGLLSYQVSATGCASSSERFKQDISYISDAHALEIVTALQSKSYHYRPETNMGDDIHFGFTAEQVGSIDPNLITSEDDGRPHAVKYNELWAFYAGAIRELQAQIAELRANK